MGARTAIILAIPIALGIVAWIVRAPKKDTARPGSAIVSTRPAPARPSAEFSPTSEEGTLRGEANVSTEPEKTIRRWRRDCLLSDYELRVRQLIESIDWTRADSRVRFPVEHDRIQAEYDEALGQLPAVDE